MPIAELPTTLKPVIDGWGETFAPVGASMTDAGVVYRVWAPDHNRVGVTIGVGNEPARRIKLDYEADGYFVGVDPEGLAGDLYRYEVDNARVPDPASRFQPLGVEGPSQVVDPRAHSWLVPEWRSPTLRGRVFYELHVGTFTAAGTFVAAIERLDALVELGVNTIELMPLGDFAGNRNWGYDGVMLFAPARCYGTPDELRLLVDAAHARGIAVVIDVVYNHFGPVGNVLARFSRDYLHASRSNPWGQSVNFDGANARAVRQFVVQNVCMWFDEYHVDGLRLDALHAIEDSSRPHIVAELVAAAHGRGGFVIGEDERNDASTLTTRAGGWGLDAVWSDDFHHALRVALTAERQAHFASYRGGPEEWLTILRDGWLFHGQTFAQWQKPRGTPGRHLPPEKFVFCLSNHDQVGNRPLGDRLHDVVSPEAYRAVSLLLCLVPYTPMLFMGQEWGASAPFPYFTDHTGEIGEKIRSGRLSEYRDKKAFFNAEVLERMPDPQAEATFLSAKLDWNERTRPAHAATLALYRECLRIRARHPIFQSAPRERWVVEMVAKEVVGVRWHEPEGDWLLLFALAASNRLDPNSPLLMPTSGRKWRRSLSSNEARFGGPEPDSPRSSDGVAEAFSGPAATLWRETAA